MLCWRRARRRGRRRLLWISIVAVVPSSHLVPWAILLCLTPSSIASFVALTSAGVATSPRAASSSRWETGIRAVSTSTSGITTRVTIAVSVKRTTTEWLGTFVTITAAIWREKSFDLIQNNNLSNVYHRMLMFYLLSMENNALIGVLDFFPKCEAWQVYNVHVPHYLIVQSRNQGTG